MTIFEALLYGAIQGLTEYLPISSSAHLALFPHFLGEKDPGLTFDVFLHIGTLLSTLIYFKKDWISILTLKRSGEVQFSKIVWGTIPALIVGGLFHKQIEAHFRSPLSMAILLALFGVILYLADRFSSDQKKLSEMSWKDAVGIGCAQCLALMPGVSRSGSTLTAGRWFGFNRESAARFSFLLSAPVTAAAIAFKLLHWEELLENGLGFWPLLVALLSSFVFGWLAIDFLMKLLRRFDFSIYAIYRVVLAVVILKYLV